MSDRQGQTGNQNHQAFPVFVDYLVYEKYLKHELFQTYTISMKLKIFEIDIVRNDALLKLTFHYKK